MSSDSFDLRGCLTELEISSGVGEILFGTGRDDDLDDGNGSLAKGPTKNSKELGGGVSAERLKSGAKLIASLDSVKQIKRRLTHKLVRENTDYAIGRYLRTEGVPAVYWDVVNSQDCIETLIRGIFYKVCRMSSSMALNSEIAELCDQLKKNTALATAYDRVGLIQRFVHSKVDNHFGEGAHSRLSVKHMRNLLSVARLHLNLHDINSIDEQYFLHMDRLSMAIANLEYFLPKETALPAGKLFFPKWRVRHLRPLTYFYEESIRKKLTELEALRGGLSLKRFADEALKIYASEIV